MNKIQRLLTRLDEIGRALEQSRQALALLGLGSAGLETDRLDEFSDLDFFAIVRAGYKQAYIDNLDWLRAAAPVAYCFRNTADGYKLLYEDGIFCEFAVFEPSELAGISFAAGRVIWKAPDFDEKLCLPMLPPPKPPQPVDWLVGEALTNLYVGLCRYRRGEKLSAARFVQGYAVDRLVDLSGTIEAERPAFRDQFTAERRYEQRFPGLAQALPGFIPGYDHTPEAALAILAFLEKHFEVNPALKAAILALCEPAQVQFGKALI